MRLGLVCGNQQGEQQIDRLWGELCTIPEIVDAILQDLNDVKACAETYLKSREQRGFPMLTGDDRAHFVTATESTTTTTTEQTNG